MYNTNAEKTQSIPMFRTIKECLALIKQEDPESSVTYYTIKGLIKQGILHPVFSGNKALINYVELSAVLRGETIG